MTNFGSITVSLRLCEQEMLPRATFLTFSPSGALLAAKEDHRGALHYQSEQSRDHQPWNYPGVLRTDELWYTYTRHAKDITTYEYVSGERERQTQ